MGIRIRRTHSRLKPPGPHGGPTTIHLSARDIKSASCLRNLDLTHSVGTLHTISRIFLHQMCWTTTNRSSVHLEKTQVTMNWICHTYTGFQRCTKIHINRIIAGRFIQVFHQASIRSSHKLLTHIKQGLLPGTWSHLWFTGVHECPPWCSIVCTTVTVHQFFCILHSEVGSLFIQLYLTRNWKTDSQVLSETPSFSKTVTVDTNIWY